MVKHSKILILKASFLRQKSVESLHFFLIEEYKNRGFTFIINIGILITLIFNVLYFVKMRPNFDVQYQIKRNSQNIFIAVFIDL